MMSASPAGPALAARCMGGRSRCERWRIWGRWISLLSTTALAWGGHRPCRPLPSPSPRPGNLCKNRDSQWVRDHLGEHARAASRSYLQSNMRPDGALLLRANLHDLAEDIAKHSAEALAQRLRHSPAQIERVQHRLALVCRQPKPLSCDDVLSQPGLTCSPSRKPRPSP